MFKVVFTSPDDSPLDFDADTWTPSLDGQWLYLTKSGNAVAFIAAKQVLLIAVKEDD